MNLIRGVVEGEDFVPVQAFVFLEMFPETFLCHCTVYTLYELALTTVQLLRL